MIRKRRTPKEKGAWVQLKRSVLHLRSMLRGVNESQLLEPVSYELMTLTCVRKIKTWTIQMLLGKKWNLVIK